MTADTEPGFERGSCKVALAAVAQSKKIERANDIPVLP